MELRRQEAWTTKLVKNPLLTNDIREGKLYDETQEFIKGKIPQDPRVKRPDMTTDMEFCYRLGKWVYVWVKKSEYDFKEYIHSSNNYVKNPVLVNDIKEGDLYDETQEFIKGKIPQDPRVKRPDMTRDMEFCYRLGKWVYAWVEQ